MIAVTSKGENCVWLTSEYHVDLEKAEYSVYCNGTEFQFGDFAPAARSYKALSKVIEEEGDPTDIVRGMMKAARAFGYAVKGHVWGNAKKEVV